MKARIISLIILLSTGNIFSFNVSLGTITKSAAEAFRFGKDFFADKQAQLEYLQNSLTTFLQTDPVESSRIQIAMGNAAEQITRLKKEESSTPRNTDFISKKLSWYNELYQTLFNLQLSRKQVRVILDDHIKLLSRLKERMLEVLTGESRAIYSFSEYREQLKRVESEERKVATLQGDLNNAQLERVSRESDSKTLLKRLTEKLHEQSLFATGVEIPPSGDDNEQFSYHQRAELLDLQIQLLQYEKELAAIRLEEATQKILFLESSLAIETEKLRALKGTFAYVREHLKIDEADLQKAREKLDRHKQEALAIKDSYYRAIKDLTLQRDNVTRELETLRKQYGITAEQERAIAEWSRVPTSVQEFRAVCEIGAKMAQHSLIEIKLELLRAQVDGKKAELRREEVAFEILTSIYNVKELFYKNSELFASEVKRYKELAAELEREQALIKERRNSTNNLITAETKIKGNVAHLKSEINNAKEVLFKRNPLSFVFCMGKVEEAEVVINEQLDRNGKLIEAYAQLIAALDETIKDIRGTVLEFENHSIWRRSEYAISMTGFRSILSDLRIFALDSFALVGEVFRSMWSVVSTGDVSSLLTIDLIEAILLVLYFFLLLLVWHLLGRCRVPLVRWMQHISNLEVFTTLHYFGAVACAIVDMCSVYRTAFVCYIGILGAIALGLLSHQFLLLCAYIFLIMWGVKAIPSLCMHILNFNATYQHILFAPLFERRFSIVFSILAYSSVILLLFRQLFNAVTTHYSEFPTILLAGYTLIARVLVIFSIGKNELLSVIPARGAIWQFFSELVERYYYLLTLCIALILIISDPYVGGYGNLVSYLLWGIISSAALIKLMLFLHEYIKRLLFICFFESNDEIVRERFAYARTSYGLLIISVSVFSGLLGLFLGARLWGKAISVREVLDIFYWPMFSTSSDSLTGQAVYFTPIKFLAIVGFILGGFVVSYLINRLILKRIFELLPVDAGIQNTIFSLTRYFTLVIAIIFGFNWGGLVTLLIGLGAVIGGIGYIVKEPIGDLVSYFILLVQRPIKVGDYIFISQNVMGFVRHITPRSVILRRNDSYFIVVPNSLFLTQPVYNWNYAKNFIAFDDIIFVVPYTVDPLFVKKLVANVLEANTNVLRSPRPVIRLEDFSENGYVFLVRGFLSDTNTSERWNIASEIRFGIVAEFTRHHIQLAVPTRVIVPGGSGKTNGAPFQQNI